jgi:hypothetical protein
VKELRTSIRGNLVKVVLAVLVTMLVVGATSVEAAKFITGKQIARNTITGKNVKAGSLQLSDLSPGTRAALRGPAGPQGPQGAQGAQGAPGIPGAPGAKGTTDIAYVDGPVVTVGSQGSNTSSAICPSGSVATGGAFGPASDVFGVDDIVFFGVSEGGFFISAFNSDAVPHNLQARAACAKR